MLKRFIRDCVSRDAAVYSPWLVKTAVATRLNIPTEMPDYIRESHLQYRSEQMVHRKRQREERLGNQMVEEAPEEERPKTKRQKAEDAKRLREEEARIKQEEDEAGKKRKPLKFPTEGKRAARQS
jgi:bromodomain adjacent to zinc finger domain protein 1A